MFYCGGSTRHIGRRRWVGVLLGIVCLSGVLLPREAFAKSEHAPATNAFFANHPLDTRGQGNMGVPEMRDPYGFDKDRDRLETGNQGRPIRVEDSPEPAPDPAPEPDPVPEPTPDPVVLPPAPDPAPEPDPVPEPTPDPVVLPPAPVVDLPAPTAAYAAWAWRHLGTGGDLQLFFDKSVQWNWTNDARIAGFEIYVRHPDESAVHLALAVDLALGPGWHTLSADPVTGDTVRVWLSDPAATARYAIAMVHQRRADQWPAGTYEHYVVPVDAQAQPGPSSGNLPCTNLGVLPVLRPTPGQVVNTLPAFQWTDLAAGVMTGSSVGFYELAVWDSGAVAPLWRKLLPLGSTAVVYDGTPLTVGRSYVLVVTVRVWDVTSPSGSSIGQSAPAVFTVQ